MKKKEIIERYGEEYYIEHYLKPNKQWLEENPDYKKQWNQYNAEHVKEYRKEYESNTKVGRGNYLVRNYKRLDKKHNRGECTLTQQWIIDHIFNSHCIYCGESDWHKLGCDRIDNSLPHTEDNVVCSCGKCNRERHTMKFEEFLLKKGK